MGAVKEWCRMDLPTVHREGLNMNGSFVVSALVAIAVFTSLTVEGIKKILDELGKKYSANILAAIVAVILTIAASAGYIIYTSTPLTPQVLVEAVAMTFLAFLCATVGYDKVVQAIKQIGYNADGV